MPQIGRQTNPRAWLMRSEFLRFISFEEDSGVMPSELARAGFYYDVQFQETICFSCGLRKNRSLWETEMSPMHVHELESPGCDFILHECTDNIPLHTFEEKGFRRKVLSQLCCGIIVRRRSKSVGSLSDNCQNLTSLISDLGAFPKERSLSQGHIPDGTAFFLQNPKPARTHLENTDQPRYPMHSDVSSRFATFRTWKSPAPVYPLCEAGFFYTGVCLSCQSVMSVCTPFELKHSFITFVL